MGRVLGAWIMKATYIGHEACELLWILRYPAGGLNIVAGPLKVSIHSGLCGFHGLSSIIPIEYEL